MKKLLTFFLLFIFFSSDSFCQSTPFPSPLKVGNKWFYYAYGVPLLDFFTFSFVVIDSGVTINGNTYYKLSNVENGTYFQYARFDSVDGYYKAYDMFDWLVNGEYWYYKKDAEKGFSWKENTNDAPYYPYFYHYVIDTATINIFGKEVIVKYIETTDSALYGSGEWWTEEFGLLKYNDEGMNAYLAGCVIDGIAYGDTTITGIEDENRNIPQEFSLSQNFPNPFNPSTTINYSIPEYTFVEIKVYDLLGKEIAALVNKEHGPGLYSIKFNGNNLASGLYIYRIRAGDFIKAKKMYLLK